MSRVAGPGRGDASVGGPGAAKWVLSRMEPAASELIMNLTTRPATANDATAMAALLNEIIAIGGTTAYEEPFDSESMDHHYVSARNLIACTVAEQDGEL